MTTLLLIRHGLNDTMGKYLSGRQAGIHLNVEGMEQARQIPEILKEIPVSAIYSSPMERTLETAAPLANERGLPVMECQGLIELDYGEWQGMTFDELRKQEAWKTVQEHPERVQFPGGESMAGAQERIHLQIDGIISQHHEDDVAACFTHNDVIKLAVAYYLNMPLHDIHRLFVSPASVTTILFGERPPLLLHFSHAGKMLQCPPQRLKKKNE